MENGPRTCVTESSAAALFVPSSTKIVGGNVGAAEVVKQDVYFAVALTG